MPFQIIRNDITKVKADIIVNTANPQPIIGSETDSAIYNAAGAEALLAERKKIGNIKSGEAAVTPAFSLVMHNYGQFQGNFIPIQTKTAMRYVQSATVDFPMRIDILTKKRLIIWWLATYLICRAD